MSNTSKWILGVLVAVVVLAVILFVLSLSQLPSKVPTAPAPTRDPVIGALATGQAQQGQALAAIQTQLAKAKEPAVNDTPIPQPTPTLSEPTQPAAPTSSEWIPYESEGGIPYSGTTWATDVAPDEIEVLTAGPACIAGVCLPGGVERGTIIIMLPASDVVVHYTVTGLIAGSNWHGSYRPVVDPSIEATWRSLAEDRIRAMQIAPNCTPGTGCVTIDVLVIGPGNKVVAQWVIGQ